jgi:hypothetical protein
VARELRVLTLSEVDVNPCLDRTSGSPIGVALLIAQVRACFMRAGVAEGAAAEITAVRFSSFSGCNQSDGDLRRGVPSIREIGLTASP